MKALLILALSFCSMVAFADDIPTLNLLEIGQKGLKFYDGKIIKVSFGWQQDGMLYADNGKPKGQRQKGGSRVVIPDAGQAWFRSLPTKETTVSSQVVYVKVSPGANGNETMDAVGRALKDGQPAW